MIHPPASATAEPVLSLRAVAKHFVLHLRGSTVLPVLEGVDLDVAAGEVVVLDGPSGQGKSTLLKLIYGNYRPSAGEIWVRPDPTRSPLELGRATPREVLELRRNTIGYVSQFLRVIPRVSALDVVTEPLIEDRLDQPGATAAGALPDDGNEESDRAVAREAAREEARRWLARLGIPSRLWDLPPATFSGGEQQRVNLARSLIKPRPLLLMDEPTASLDAGNTATVIEIIREARARGAAIVGIFHDDAVAHAVATRRVPMARFHAAPVPLPGSAREVMPA